MKVTFEIDTAQCSAQEHESYRAAAAYLLHLTGDLDKNEAVTPPPPPVVPVDSSDDEPTSNVLPFPVPPPPPPPSIPTADTAAPIPPAPPATTAAVVSTVVSAEFDSAGMPWDARIHQKSKNKTKPGCWKVIKGLDATILAAVTAELAARKGASAPVSLPGSVPLPPVANGAGVGQVPTPPAPPVVPVPPVAPAGALPISAFRELVDKLTTATKAQQITPAKANEICQAVGAPNLMELNKLPHLIPEVSSRVDAFLAGLG